MFLGYSEKDETLLRQHNNVTVLDAVSSLDNFMREEVNNQVRDRLSSNRLISTADARQLILLISNASHLRSKCRRPGIPDCGISRGSARAATIDKPLSEESRKLADYSGISYVARPMR